MRDTLVWKEMRELAPALGILAAGDLLLGLAFWRLSAGTLPDGFLAGLFCFAAAALGASLFARDRRPGTLSLLLSLPIPRSRILSAKLAAGSLSLLLVALGGLAAGGLAVRQGWIWKPGPENTIPWGTALLATALLSALLAVRMALDWPEPLLPLVAGGGLGAFAFQVIWVEVASFRGNVMALLAVLGAITAVVWRLRARFETVEDRTPRWSLDLWTPRPGSRRRAPILLGVEWRQKRTLLGILALLPLLHLVGVEAGWLETFSILGCAWLSGALLGASLFTAEERDATRSLLHVLPIGRGRLAAGRLLGGLILGGLYSVEYLLVVRAEERSFRFNDPFFEILLLLFFYGSSFLTGAALSPWLRSTVMAALLALVSTYLAMLMFVFLSETPIGNLIPFWAGTGLLLAVFAVVAGWSTVRSRAFEPSPRKGLRVLLTVLAVWLAVAGLLYLS